MPHVQGTTHVPRTTLILLLCPSTMSGPPNKRRRTKAIGPDSSQFVTAFTNKTITTTNRSGIVVQKDVLVPLVPIKPTVDDAQVPSHLMT